MEKSTEHKRYSHDEAVALDARIEELTLLNTETENETAETKPEVDIDAVTARMAEIATRMEEMLAKYSPKSTDTESEIQSDTATTDEEDIDDTDDDDAYDHPDFEDIYPYFR